VLAVLGYKISKGLVSISFAFESVESNLHLPVAWKVTFTSARGMAGCRVTCFLVSCFFILSSRMNFIVGFSLKSHGSYNIDTRSATALLSNSTPLLQRCVNIAIKVSCMNSRVGLLIHATHRIEGLFNFVVKSLGHSQVGLEFNHFLFVLSHRCLALTIA